MDSATVPGMDSKQRGSSFLSHTGGKSPQPRPRTKNQEKSGIVKNQKNYVIASSFADPADIRRFRACKATGKSDRECFKVGDNGIGCWGDDTTQDKPMVALPPEDWKPLGNRARGALVLVIAGKRTVLAELRDTMPRKANIKNGCGIDLNPAACEALGYEPPVKIAVTWQWVEEFGSKQSDKTPENQRSEKPATSNKTPETTPAETFADSIANLFEWLLSGIRRKK